MRPLGGAGQIGWMLGKSGGVLVPWYLAGDVPAANCVAAYQPRGAASLAASYVNLANPGTYDAAPGVAPTFDASTGWTFNGTDQYLETGATQADSLYSLVARYSDAVNGPILGINITNVLSIVPYNSTFGTYYVLGYPNAAAGAISSGVIGVRGEQNVGGYTTKASIYKNGLYHYAAVTGAGYLGGGDYIIGGDWGADYFAGKIQALAIYNITLTEAQVLAITNAMNAL